MFVITHYLKRAIIVLLLLGGIVLIAYKPKLSVKQNLVFEYGAIKPTLEDFIDTDRSMYTSVEIHFLSDETGDGTNTHVGVGKVLITAYRGLQQVSERIEYQVEDTQYPTLSGVETIKLKYGEEADLTGIKGSDEVDGDLEVEIVGKYDQLVPGTYELLAVATDKHANKTALPFEIIIAKPEPVIVQKPQVEKPVRSIPEKPSADTKGNKVEEEVIGSALKYVAGHLIANKKHPLPSGYAPGENREARLQLNDLIAEMQGLGMNIGNAVSGYRSHGYQAQLYNNYVQSHGLDAANRLIAKPGYSEHQTGLSFDLKHNDGSLVGMRNLQASAGEVAWIAENAARYGFIVRYPQGKESITGYQYEPWHLRYLGNDALKIYQSGLTMEEYFGFAG